MLIVAKRKGKFEQPRQKERDLSIPVYVERKNQQTIRECSSATNKDLDETVIIHQNNQRDVNNESEVAIDTDAIEAKMSTQQKSAQEKQIKKDQSVELDLQATRSISPVENSSDENAQKTMEQNHWVNNTADDTFLDQNTERNDINEEKPSKPNRIKKVLISSAFTVASIAIFFILLLSNMQIRIDTSEIPAIVEYNKSMTTLPKATCGILPIKVVATNGLDTTKLGQQTLHYEADWLWKKASADVNVVVTDKVPPKIELNPNDKVLEYDEEYIEDGFIATDDYDGDLTDKVKPFYSNNKAYYFVSDSSNNYAFAERDIIRKEADTTKPEIKLNGKERMTIQIGDEYKEPGFTAIDNVDGDLTKNVVVNDNIDTETIGSYKVSYTATDTMGNNVTATRIVDVMPESTNKGEGETIYLTFDDGPSGNTEFLLQTLAKYNVKATFFVLSDTDYNEALTEIVNSGNSIGVHWKNHSYEEAYASEESYLNGLKEAQKKIETITGVRPTMIRFLGGTSNTVSSNYSDGIMYKLIKSAPENGFTYFDWNVDSNDASGQLTTKEEVTESVIDGIRNNPYDYAVVLQHDVKDFSVAAVEDIIIWGLSNGYQFDVLSADGPRCQHQAQI